MAKILNVKDQNSMKAAIDLGIAMQLTNIARDVVEDSKNNRFYIQHDFQVISNTLTLADLFYKSCFTSIKKSLLILDLQYWLLEEFIEK